MNEIKKIVIHEFNLSITVNQLLFATTLFRDLIEINWFTMTYFCDQALFTLEMSLHLNSKDWFAARIICDNETLANLTNTSCMQEKLVYSIQIKCTRTSSCFSLFLLLSMGLSGALASNATPTE